MKFKLEISLNDPSFQADPQMTLAHMLMQVGHWVRETPWGGIIQRVDLYGNGGEVLPPIGKAEFLPDEPFKKK